MVRSEKKNSFALGQKIEKIVISHHSLCFSLEGELMCYFPS